MYDPQFTDTIVSYLAEFHRVEDRPELVAQLVLPLHQDYTFGVEVSGVVDLKREETGSRRTIRRKLTPQHITAFKEEITAKLDHYRATIDHNRQVSRFYQTPTFTVDDAVAMAQEALFASFKRVRESYRQE